MLFVCCVTLHGPSKRVASCLAVIFLLVAQTLGLQTVVQNVTRDDKGDTFSNPNPNCNSNSCRRYKKFIGGFSSSQGNCKCSCNFEQTFVVHNTSCVDSNRLQSNLLGSLPGKDASFRVTYSQCPSKSMPTLDVTTTDSLTLCITSTPITNCKVIDKDSKYFYVGVWNPIWLPNRQQDTFSIIEENGIVSLQWKSLGKQFSGLIFGLRISCHLQSSLQDDKTFESYLLFKSSGSHYFNGDKPTVAPLTSDTTPQGSTSFSATQTTIASSVFPTKSNKGSNSNKQQNKGLIAGLTIFAILVILVIVAVVIFFLRRKRNGNEKPPNNEAKSESELRYQVSRHKQSPEAKSEANPTYELGQDKSIPLRVNGQSPAYDYPDVSSRYQPLVQNTRMRDATGKVPVYTPLNRQTDGKRPVLKLKAPDKRGLAYETVAVPIQHPPINSPDVQESPDYEDPTNPTIPNQGISSPEDGTTIDFENTAYSDPDSVIRLG